MNFTYDGKPLRNILFVGDSYQKGYGNNNKSFVDYIVEWWSGSLVNNWFRVEANGHGFAKQGSQFITLLETVEQQSYFEPLKKEFTDIIVTGGANDSVNPGGVIDAMRLFAEHCREVYPNADIWVAPVGWSFAVNSRASVLSAINNWFRGANTYGYRIMGNIATLFRDRALLTSDNIHPNDNGQRQLAMLMRQCLETGSCVVSQGANGVNFTRASGVSFTGDFMSSAYNGMATFYNTEKRLITFSSNRTINGLAEPSGAIPLGVCTNSKTWGYAVDTNSIVESYGTNVTITARNESDNKYYNVGCRIFIRNGTLYLQPLAVGANGGALNFQTKAIYLPAFEFTVSNYYG